MQRLSWLRLVGTISGGVVTAAALLFEIRNATVEFLGYQVQWAWWALGAFSLFAGSMYWLVATLWPDQARVAVRTESLKKHLLTDIPSLIDRWKSEINTPRPVAVGLTYSGLAMTSEDDPLFDSLKEHLRDKAFWRSYESWKATTAEYVEKCKSCRTKIRQSWAIKKVTITWNFEQPIIKVLAGEDKELRYTLSTAVGHTSSELKYQILEVNRQSVLELPHEERLTYPTPQEHEQCKREESPLEYQRVADQFLQGSDAKELVGLYQTATELQTKIRKCLQSATLVPMVINRHCRNCQLLR